MKSMMGTPVLLAGVLLLVGSAASEAPMVEATVPFPFSVRGQVLPAGQYRVERDASDPTILLIRGQHGVRASAITTSTSAAGQDPAGGQVALVFTKGETGYRLKDVWEGHASGREIPSK